MLTSPAFALLLVARLLAVSYSPIQDCDEVFNYWDPTHFLTHGFGLQTWEYSPVYAIRSWAYAGLHALIIKFIQLIVIPLLSRLDLLPNSISTSAMLFYGLRCVFAVCSAAADTFLYLQIKRFIDIKFRYTIRNNSKTPWLIKPSILCLIFSVFATGNFHASIAYLPSSFAMTCFNFALGHLIEYVNSISTFPISKSKQISASSATFKGISLLALGGLAGWPFELALALPWLACFFIIYPVFILISQKSKSPQSSSTSSISNPTDQNEEPVNSLSYLSLCAIPTFLKLSLIVSSVLVVIVSVDSFLYGSLSVVPLNIVLYNVLFANEQSGPDIFGTEPWYYYLVNLALNFNIALLLCLAVLPAFLLHIVVRSFREEIDSSVKKFNKKQVRFDDVNIEPTSYFTSAFQLLVIIPFYLWFTVFTLQPHKEERFMYVVYSSICLNASLALTLLYNSALQIISTIQVTRAFLFRAVKVTANLAVLIFVVISVLRSAALASYYAAPIQLFQHISSLNVPAPTPDINETDLEKNIDSQLVLPPHVYNTSYTTICMGREWYRFPSSYFLPDNARLAFIKSGFDGLLPGPFRESHSELPSPKITSSSSISEFLSSYFYSNSSAISGIWTPPLGKNVNNMNKQDLSLILPLEKCTYIVESGFPIDEGDDSSKVVTSADMKTNENADHEDSNIGDNDNGENNLKHDSDYQKVYCVPMFDSSNSKGIARLLYLPLPTHIQNQILPLLRSKISWSELCLYKKNTSSHLTN